jgi:hypothetical protein
LDPPGADAPPPVDVAQASSGGTGALAVGGIGLGALAVGAAAGVFLRRRLNAS